tara:strand:- start:4167 stop:5594 length:1428 start_codon:yes stop_codon:yes gene_type:complete
MLFNSVAFLVFIVVFLPIFFNLNNSWKNKFLLLSSYFFYSFWDWRFLLLIIVSTCVDYFIGLKLECTENKPNRKLLLLCSVVTNLAILGFFKYCNFFIDSFSELLQIIGINGSWNTLNIILPVGISFYTFQSMSYTLDVYNRKCLVEKNFFLFATYIALFPQLVAGPIVRASHLLPQMKLNHSYDYFRMVKGIEIIIWGYFLKLCVADRLDFLVTPVYSNPDAYGGAAHLIATFSFSFQIYADFFGYSLIAIGLGKIMGYDFGINFKRPYLATNFSDFWERWHISLSSWLRDYLYIPLGGNRNGTVKTLRNLLVVMFLGGLWHGAAWTYVIWGVIHGIYLVLQNLISNLNLKLTKAPIASVFYYKLFKITLVFNMISFSWIFFRAESLDSALLIISRIFEFNDYFHGASYDLFALVIGVCMITIVISVDVICEFTNIKKYYFNNVVARSVCSIMLLWLIVFLGVFEGTTFIYFQF